MYTWLQLSCRILTNMSWKPTLATVRSRYAWRSFFSWEDSELSKICWRLRWLEHLFIFSPTFLQVGEVKPQYHRCPWWNLPEPGHLRLCWRSWTRSRIAVSGIITLMSAAQFPTGWTTGWTIIESQEILKTEGIWSCCKCFEMLWVGFEHFVTFGQKNNIAIRVAVFDVQVPVDLSNILFLSTANVLDTIPGPLLAAWHST